MYTGVELAAAHSQPIAFHCGPITRPNLNYTRFIVTDAGRSMSSSEFERANGDTAYWDSYEWRWFRMAMDADGGITAHAYANMSGISAGAGSSQSAESPAPPDVDDPGPRHVSHTQSRSRP